MYLFFIISNTFSAVRFFMQLKCPFGQTLSPWREQGEQGSFPNKSIELLSYSNIFGSVGPNITKLRVLTPLAIWKGPLSLVTTKSALESKAPLSF